MVYFKKNVQNQHEYKDDIYKTFLLFNIRHYFSLHLSI